MVHDREEVQRTVSGKVSRHYASPPEPKIAISALTVMTRLDTGLYFVSVAVLWWIFKSKRNPDMTFSQVAAGDGSVAAILPPTGHEAGHELSGEDRPFLRA